MNGHTSHKFSFNIFFLPYSGLSAITFASIAQIFLLFPLVRFLSLALTPQSLSLTVFAIRPMFLLTGSLFIAFRSVIYWPNFMFVTSMRTDKFHRKYVSEPSFFFLSHMFTSFLSVFYAFVVFSAYVAYIFRLLNFLVIKSVRSIPKQKQI